MRERGQQPPAGRAPAPMAASGDAGGRCHAAAAEPQRVEGRPCCASIPLPGPRADAARGQSAERLDRCAGMAGNPRLSAGGAAAMPAPLELRADARGRAGAVGILCRHPLGRPAHAPWQPEGTPPNARAAESRASLRQQGRQMPPGGWRRTSAQAPWLAGLLRQVCPGPRAGPQMRDQSACPHRSWAECGCPVLLSGDCLAPPDEGGTSCGRPSAAGRDRDGGRRVVRGPASGAAGREARPDDAGADGGPGRARRPPGP